MSDMPLIDSTLCSILKVKVDKIKEGDKIKYHTDKNLKITVVFQMILRQETITSVITTEGDVDALYRAIFSQIDNRYNFHTLYNNRSSLEETIDELGTILGLHIRRGEIIYAQIERYGCLESGWYKRMRAPKAFEGVA